MSELTAKELANRAEALVTSGVVSAVADALRVNLFNEWMGSDPDAVKDREALYQRALGLEMLVTSISNIASENARTRQEENDV